MPNSSARFPAAADRGAAWVRTGQLVCLAASSLRARLSGSGASRTAALDRVAHHLGRMHGLPQKLGQILAFREGALAPRETLRPSALPAARARQIVAERLGRPLAEVFSEFSPNGIAASIGQVHRARLCDGRVVAVKFQHPGIAAALRADLRALGWLAAPLSGWRPGFDLSGFRAEIGDRLAAELDYTREAAALREFAAGPGADPEVELPESVADLHRPGLLVLTWLEGTDLETARGWPRATRAALASTLVRLFLAGLFKHRLLHADPHPGNYRFRRVGPAGGPTVGLLDFGSMHRLTERESGAMQAAVRASQAGPLTAAQAWHFHLDLGYNPLTLAPLRESLPAVLGVLLQPFAAAGPFDAAAWAPGPRLAELLGAHRLAYRLAAPPGLIFLIRAWHGLGRYLRVLDVPVDWGQIAAPLLAAAPGVGAAAPCPPAGPEVSLHLHVQRAGVDLIRLQLPAQAAELLHALVPAQHGSHLRALGFDAGAIASQVRASAFAPQELFSADRPDQRVRIWLE